MTTPSKTRCCLKYEGFNDATHPLLWLTLMRLLTGWSCALPPMIPRRCVAWAWSLGCRWKRAEGFWSGLRSWASTWLGSASMSVADAPTHKPSTRQLRTLAACSILGWVGSLRFPPHSNVRFNSANWSSGFIFRLEWTGLQDGPVGHRRWLPWVRRCWTPVWRGLRFFYEDKLPLLYFRPDD